MSSMVMGHLHFIHGFPGQAQGPSCSGRGPYRTPSSSERHPSQTRLSSSAHPDKLVSVYRQFMPSLSRVKARWCAKNDRASTPTIEHTVGHPDRRGWLSINWTNLTYG